MILPITLRPATTSFGRFLEAAQAAFEKLKLYYDVVEFGLGQLLRVLGGFKENVSSTTVALQSRRFKAEF